MATQLHFPFFLVTTSPIYNHHSTSSSPKPFLILSQHSSPINKPTTQTHLQLHSIAKYLNQSADTLSLKQGTELHARLIRLGFSTDIYLSSKLLHFYFKIRDVDSACSVYNSIPKHLLNQFFSNTMIRAYVDAARYADALEFFSEMTFLGFSPNEFTYPFALKACSCLGFEELGRQIHGLMVVSGYQSEVFSMSALLDLYVKCGCFCDACRLFERMSHRNEITWNSMIYGYASNGYWVEALEALEVMKKCGIEVKVSSWNSIMAGCVRCGNAVLAFETLRRMLIESSLSVKPNFATFNTLLSVIATDISLIQLKELHGFALKQQNIIGLNCIDEDRLCSAILSGYAFHGSMVCASRLFEGTCLKTWQLWISMILGFIDCKQSHEAFNMFRKMIIQYNGEFKSLSKVPLTMLLPECSPSSMAGLEIHGLAYRVGFESNTSVCNALINMYARRRSMDLAERVFLMTPEKDVVSWNTLIASYASNGEFDEAFNFFCKMRSDHFMPDEFTLSSIISGCGELGAPRKGAGIHAHIIQSGFFDGHVVIQNALIDMYGKCGCIEEARKIFDDMTYKDHVSWNTMISCYGMNAFPHEAFSLFNEMQELGWKPNRVSFIALLSTCSHAGLVTEALHFLESMTSMYGIIPDVDHYACIVDTLGRAGQLYEAYDLIKNMPVKPDDCVWGALLSGCRIHGNVSLAEVVAGHLIELKPHHPGYHVLLSNIYKDASQLSEAMEVRTVMKDKGVKKFPGCSWIEINGEIHNFLTSDKTHIKAPAIYSSLHGLTEQLMSEGYIPSIMGGKLPSDNGKRETS